MKECKECGKEISTRAEKCPHCGAPIKQRKTIGCLGLIGIILLIGWAASFFPDHESNDSLSKTTNTYKTSTPSKTPEQIHADKIKKSFSGWDGSHIGLTMLIKEDINDPGSYDHIKTVYWDHEDYLIVKTTFRGKNAFGGIVKNWVSAKVDLDGNVIAIIAQGP